MSDTIHLSYQLQGPPERPVILFVHGFCEDRRIWAPLLPHLDPEYCHILVDLPGFGESPQQPGWSMSDVAYQLAAILDRLGKDRCLLVGHSMGGYAGMAFLAQYPQRLHGLSLFHSHPFADSGEKKAGRRKSIDFIERQGSRPFVSELIPSLFTPESRIRYPELIRSLTEQAAAYEPAAIQDALRAMIARENLSRVLSDTSVPIQFIIGSKDETIDPALSWKQTHLPKTAQVDLMRESAHAAMWEETAAAAAAINAFTDFCL